MRFLQGGVYFYKRRNPWPSFKRACLNIFAHPAQCLPRLVPLAGEAFDLSPPYKLVTAGGGVAFVHDCAFNAAIISLIEPRNRSTMSVAPGLI